MIIEVGKFNIIKDEFKDAEVLQFNNHAIIPGLIDSHTHLSLTRLHESKVFNDLFQLMEEAADLHRKNNKRFFSKSCEYGKQICLENGITCVVDWRHCGVLSSDYNTKIRHILGFEVWS